ncbi:MAG: AAA family ATPase [Myxococcota bacterium]
MIARVELGNQDRRELPVVNGEGEARLARVLSDGDRSTLALAVFLAGLDTQTDIANAVVVFDDPMTSMDWSRCVATAEAVTKCADVAAQVLVLSHHAPFLAQVAADWRRFGGRSSADLVELALDRGSRAFVGRKSEDQVTHEHLSRWRELAEFASGRASDDHSLERLCAFGARANHAGGHRDVEPPTPEAVRQKPGSP